MFLDAQFQDIGSATLSPFQQQPGDGIARLVLGRAGRKFKHLGTIKGVLVKHRSVRDCGGYSGRRWGKRPRGLRHNRLDWTLLRSQMRDAAQCQHHHGDSRSYQDARATMVRCGNVGVLGEGAHLLWAEHDLDRC